MCVEIMREKITIKDAIKQCRERIFADSSDEARHLNEIIEADEKGDTKKVAELVKAGYKKERWI
jgi:hypothetical protein